jgi:hypothetical protein
VGCRVPLVLPWQRRLAKRLAGALTAPLAAPILSPRRARGTRMVPRLTSGGTHHRLLVVQPVRGREGVRLRELAETYLGSRRRFREIVALNQRRHGPRGERIDEDTRVGPGWTLLMPPDAIGIGLVEAPEEAGSPLAPAADGAARAVPPRPPDAQSRDADPPTAALGVVAPNGAPRPGSDPVPGTPNRAASAVQPPRPSGRGGDREHLAATARPAAPLDRHTTPILRIGSAQANQSDHPPADLAWDLVHARLLADGIRGAMRSLRLQREHDRPPGAGVSPLDPEAAAVQIATELGADVPGAEFLDRALRLLAAGLAARAHRVVPEVVVARLRADSLELTLREPDPLPPRPFSSDGSGRHWSISREVAAPAPAVPAPLPGLVSLGCDRNGRILIDLEAAPGPVCLAGDPHAVRLVLLALGLEVATKRWSDRMSVTMIGFDVDIDAVDLRLRRARDLADVLEEVLAVAATNRRVIDCGGYGSAMDWRVRAGAGQPVLTQVLVLAEPPTAQQAARLHGWVGAPNRAGLAVVHPGEGVDAGWQLRLDATGVLTGDDPSFRAGAQALAPSTASAIGRLARAERGSVLRDPGFRASGPPLLLRPATVGEARIVVGLFGAPRLRTAGGDVAADPRTVEIVAFLALHERCTRAELARAIWPTGTADSDVAEALRAVDATLGAEADGRRRLVADTAGRLSLTSDVQPDWHLFVALATAGDDTGALSLVAPDRAGEEPAVADGLHFGWLAALPVARTLPGFVADVAHRHARRCLAQNRADLAAAAAGAGLRVQPFSQVLREDLEVAVRTLRPTPAGGDAGPSLVQA